MGTERTEWVRSALVASLLVGLLAVPLNATPSARASSPLLSLSARPAELSPRLAVDPSSWWMAAGAVTSFAATWVDPTPGCSLTPYWFRWSIAGASAEGSVGSATGATVNFTATSVASGNTTLLVRSAAVLACGPVNAALFATADANVTVVAPLILQNLSLAPNPIGEGALSVLRGELAGGEPPYLLRIAWGDGTNSTDALARGGSFSVPHPFESGTFWPTITVDDSDGLIARATVGEAVTANSGMVAGIEAATYVTDVDTPVQFNATVLHADGPYATGWSCGTSAAPQLSMPSERPASESTAFSCAFSQPGTGAVFFEALPLPPLPPVTATLSETVVPTPTLQVWSPNLTAEVGQPALVTFRVAGGAPPLEIDWEEVGSSTHGRFAVPTDGRVLLPVTPTEAGSLGLVARLTDAEGFRTSNVTARFLVDPALNDSIVSERAATGGSLAIALTSTVTAGTPPYAWAVVPATLPSNETSPAGTLDSVGWFGWSATPATEGWTTVTVVVVDSAGGLVATTREVESVPPLTGNLSVASGNSTDPGTFDLDLSFSGGAPPIAVTVNASDGEGWDRTDASDTPATWAFPTRESGALRVQVTAVDALGDSLEWNETVWVSAPVATGSSGGPASPLLVDGVAVGLLVMGALLGGFYLLGRRRPRTAPATPDPVEVLRRIIEPAEGADRSTVELLAEEAGVPLDVVRATLDRLIVEGRVRSDDSGEDGEVVAWSSEP